MAKPLVSAASNVSDSTIQKHIRAISALKETADSAHAEYRASLKAAKTAGINTKQLIEAMGARKREVEDVHSDLKMYVRYLSILNMKVQLDLFGNSLGAAAKASSGDDAEDGEDDGDGEDEGDESEHEQWKATEAGVAAGKAGRFKDDNPHHAGTFKHAAWHNGWMKGQETLVTKGGVKNASPRRSRAARAPMN